MLVFFRATALCSLLLVGVRADFGDYVDPTFNCPATTTCGRVCVANVTDCPAEMLCGVGEQLCLDGSCAAVCPDMDEESSPCAFACAPVACAKVIDNYDNCKSKYGPWYDAEAACGKEEAAETIHLWNFTEAGFVFFYSWILVVTALVYGWCAFNQRIAPVEGSTKSLELNFSKSGEKELSQGWQTGYKIHPVGAVINVLTFLTLFGIQGLLAWLTIQYYVQQELFTNFRRVFDDEAQVLKAFIVTWFVGFFWTFAMKFPYSISSLHYRRCDLGEATHVAIAVVDGHVKDTENTFDDTYIHNIRKFFSSFFWFVNEVMTFVFSERNFFGCERSSSGYYRVIPVTTDPNDGTRYIMFRFRRYNLADGKFVPGVVNQVQTIGDVIQANTASGLSDTQIQATRSLIGDNTISMPKPTFLRCLKHETSKPFYTYQTFMVWTWFPLWYYYMAITWSILIITAALAVSFFQYRNESSLYRITKIVGDVKVVRDGVTKTIPHQQLVPGDVIIVEDGVAYCDMVVVSTKTLLVDESALTGESNYVGKVEIDPSQGSGEEYDSRRHKRNTVFAGTTVLENEETMAIVTNTASFTARGELIRDIYSFSRHRFKFDVEVPIVLSILFFYAVSAFVITNQFIKDLFVYGFFYGMFVVGTILPPLLPTVFTVSVGVSDHRLSRKRVACTNSESILVAGKVTRAFFDKTGTLTKQGLDFLSVRSAIGWDKGVFDDMSDAMASGMAVCHTLTRSKAGDLVGNPVDKTMFEASGATINGTMATAKHGLEMTILKQFDFDHHSMTQSTIVKTGDGQIIAYVKGSGENMKALCSKQSIPSDFDAALRECAIQGIYQITMAMKVLPADTDASKFLRSELEKDLIFIGVINFKNSIREETPDVIRKLAQGEVESIMVTGDSILTGIRIARESGIISDWQKVLVGGLTDDGISIIWRNEDHEESVLPPIDNMKQAGCVLAISGEAFSVMLSADAFEAQKLIHYIRVYGRCTPYDKVSVISQFVKQGYVTLMAGDGGNDCGALKTAHVGVALSDAEASIVAPFTSLDKTITNVVDVLLEGRCGLASALASYKYMIMYGQVETLLQIICAYFSITFAEWCWVFMDGIWSVSLAFALPLSAAAPKLVQSRPTASILGLQTVSSAVGILLINFLYLVGALAYLWSQDWFACRMWDSTDVSNVLVIGDNYETEVLFLVGGFQYIHAAAAFNFGYEFRQAWYRNYLLAGLVTFFSAMQIYILFVPGEVSCIWRVNCVNEDVRVSVTEDLIPIQNDFNTTVMPEYFRRGLFGIMIANAASVVLYEYFVVNGIRRHFAAKKRAAVTAFVSSQKDREQSVTIPSSLD